MKKHIIFSFLLLLITINLWAFDREKKITRSFKVNNGTKVKIKNSFGKVHINTWDKNQVDVEIAILTKSKNEAKAQEMLNKIKIKIEENYGQLEFNTEIGKINSKNNESYEVNYTINMPSKNPLEVKNSFGDFYLDDYDGPVELNLSYGALKIGRLNGPAEIKVSFNKGENIIKSISKGELDVSYTDLTLNYAENLNLDNEFSNVTIENANMLDVDVSYGRLKIDKVNSLSGDLEFSSLDLGSINRLLVLDISYGKNLNINNINPAIEKIKIESEFSSIKLVLPRQLNANLSAEVEFGDINYDKGMITMDYIENDFTSKEYRGKIGSGSSKRIIALEVSYGSISLDLK
jgi:hypothetical protein